MFLVLLVGIWRTPTRNTGRKFSGYLGTCVVLMMFVFILGGREMVLSGMLILILQDILIKEDLLLGMCLLLEVMLSVGKLLCRLQLRCRLPGRIYGYY